VSEILLRSIGSPVAARVRVEVRVDIRAGA